MVAAEKVEQMDPAGHSVGCLARGAWGADCTEECGAAERAGEEVGGALEKWEAMA